MVRGHVRFRRGQSRVVRCAAFVAGFATLSVSPAKGDSQLFTETVWPILQTRCSACHSPATKTSGFSIEDEQSVIRGGNRRAPAVIGGAPERSPLLKLLRGDIKPQMPMGGSLLPAEMAAI
jgi:hypothetical protein